MIYNRYKTKYWSKKKYRTPVTTDQINHWIDRENWFIQNCNEGLGVSFYRPLTIKIVDKRKDGIDGSDITEYRFDVRCYCDSNSPMVIKQTEELVDLLFTKSLYMTITYLGYEGIGLSISDDHSTNIDADVIDRIVELVNIRREAFRKFCEETGYSIDDDINYLLNEAETLF